MKKFLVLLVLFTCTVASAREYTAELAIVGGGWSGIIAAVAAGEAGINTVVLEKNPTTGGGGVYIGGINATGAPGMLSVDEGFSNYMEATHNVPDGRAVRAAYGGLARNIQWLKDRGVKFGESMDGKVLMFGGAGGSDIMKNMNSRLEKMKNVTILTETPVKQLIIDKNNAVIGVIAENDGEEVKVNAKYTIIATGPIVNSPEMIAKYAPYMGTGYKVLGAPNRTGDGINLAKQAGAKIDTIIAMDTEAGHTMDHNSPSAISDPEMMALHILVKNTILRVNSVGKRFMNEATAVVRFDFGDAVLLYHEELHAIARNNNIYYTILDEKLKNDLINKSAEEAGISKALTPYGLKGEKLGALAGGLEKAYAKGYAFKANTIEELAQKLNMNPKTLKATVDRYNELADKNADTDFVKPAKYLYKYGKGPYYAIKAEHTIISSNGGIQANENFQVIREDFSEIPGLYVAGVMLGSQVGDTYPMMKGGGTSSGFGISASLTIVENIAKELKK
jgi:fumarate reductase flavoprotein subunit